MIQMTTPITLKSDRSFDSQAFLNTVIAGLLSIGSILILYSIVHPNARLGIVIGFVVLFAGSVRRFTSAMGDSRYLCIDSRLCSSLGGLRI